MTSAESLVALRMENKQLRAENERLRAENGELRTANKMALAYLENMIYDIMPPLLAEDVCGMLRVALGEQEEG